MKPQRLPAAARPAKAAAAPTSLVALNEHLALAAAAARGAQGLSDMGVGPWPDLRSAQRFRETWERLGAEVMVQQARARAPQNAGPLNPQRLMIETLALMGDLSPHYLRRFMAHAETLLWLEEAQGRIKGAAPARKAGSAAAAGKTPRHRK